MRIVLAPNTFKESLSATRVAEAMKAGVQKVYPNAECICVPLADGGDGTTEALVAAKNGEWRELSVHDPLMRPAQARYGLIDNGQTAVMEMAAASGLWRLQEHEKNPLKTTTYGTGELLRDAIEQGVGKILIGIGGSATNDGGIGMAAALGYRFLDRDNNELQPIGETLNSICKIDSSRVIQAIRQVQIYVASDVTNPLTGKEGASAIYGPQKGATPKMVETLDAGLRNLAERCQEDLGVVIGDFPGDGAAGGLGAGLRAFAQAEIKPGFDLVADVAELNQALQDADLVFTGEGKLDASTRFGKVPSGVAKRAKVYNVPVIGLSGAIEGDAASLQECGIDAVFSIVPGPVTIETALQHAEEWIERTTEQVMRLWQQANEIS